MRKTGTALCAYAPPKKMKVSTLVLIISVNCILSYFTAGCQEKSAGSVGPDVLSDRQTRPAVLLQTLLCDLKWI